MLVLISVSCVQKNEASITIDSSNFPKFDLNINNSSEDTVYTSSNKVVLRFTEVSQAKYVSLTKSCDEEVWQDFAEEINLPPAEAEGELSLFIKLKSEYGFVSPCKKKKIVLDWTPPQWGEGALKLSSPKSKSSTESPVISWDPALDSGSGISNYEWSLGTTSGASDLLSWEAIGNVLQGRLTKLNFETGKTYCPSVRAVDRAGFTSSSLSGPCWQVDSLPPQIISVTPPSPGNYFFDEALTFQVKMSEVVLVTGVPRLRVNIGMSLQYVNYVSGSGSDTLVFSRKLTVYDSDRDGLTMNSSIDLNGGKIEDEANNLALLTLGTINLSQVKVNACADNFVLVKNLLPYTSRPFCVAKYEMKAFGREDGQMGYYDASLVPESRASGSPWGGASRDEAIAECQSMGTGFDLITNSQWQTIARDIESTPSNWAGGIIGSAGGLNRGRSNPLTGAAAASTDDNQACFGNTQTCSLSVWNEYRRVFILSTGHYVWDFGGNVWEWVKDDVTYSFGAAQFISQITSASHSGSGNIGGLEGDTKFHFGPAGDYSLATTPPYAGLGYGYLGSNQGTIVRGGDWFYRSDTYKTGVFSVNIWFTPNADRWTNLGFRCVQNL